MDPSAGTMARSLRKRQRDGESFSESLNTSHQYRVAYDVREEKEELEWKAAHFYGHVSAQVKRYHDDARSADTTFYHENPANKAPKADSEKTDEEGASDLAAIKARVASFLPIIAFAADINDDKTLEACQVLLEFGERVNNVVLMNSLLLALDFLK
ncbi:BnaA10g12050D [Brassica napus]|uniref:(rape) hypothetical protein n=1 Tax=Brassica napus TaxID=3708 RepID=A0A078H666_BRANA|nr:unnamed protein product [Brassica napus]CDY32999.1 BnaA10g12050D [Brassica napus]